MILGTVFDLPHAIPQKMSRICLRYISASISLRNIPKVFWKALAPHITEKEIQLLPVSAFILTYELVLRFLGDYLNGDIYFQVHRDKHNLERARAQLKLATDMEKKLPYMENIIKKYT